MNNTVIKVENLSKKYIIGHQIEGRRYVAFRDVLAKGIKSLARRCLNPFKKVENGFDNSVEEFWALKDVFFDIHESDRVGIIGRNGAGKSTLLKILSRITDPSGGRVKINGRVASLLEVGTGFHPELTGRENIYLNGAILGMTQVEIKKKFDEIVDFAEVEKFLDTPVKRYSSGMYVRLAFSVAAHLEPEILLVDEVLAVGDSQFQKKCLGKMDTVSREGRTVLFVSHNMDTIRKLCNSCILLNKGIIVKQGDTNSIVDLYVKDGLQELSIASNIFPEDKTREAQVRCVKLLDEEGDTTQSFDCDNPVTIDLVFQIHKPIKGLYIYIRIERLDGTVTLVGDSYDSGHDLLCNLFEGFYQVKIIIPPRTLGAGEYGVAISLASPFAKDGSYTIDFPGVACSFRLDDISSRRGNKRGGYLSTLLSWKLDKIPNIE